MGVIVYEITHSGEGEPGRSVEILDRHANFKWYAQKSSEYFDDADDLAARIHDEHDHLDGTSRVVEVRVPGKSPGRFTVRCRVVREYEASELED